MAAASSRDCTLLEAFVFEPRGQLERDVLVREARNVATALCTHINVQAFEHTLVTERLITQSTLEDAWEKEQDQCAVALRLLNAVADNVLLSPSNFSRFLHVLRDEPAMLSAQNTLLNVYGTPTKRMHACAWSGRGYGA